ncbi:MAG: glycerol-3-phosphate 1-O-acyltransferase PlsY [Ruminococcaceae bacterium]|nr:glycerol-3-phosphate 1-O-acyltransferase PlsY [Oscillospiraceae bacterium]
MLYFFLQNEIGFMGPVGTYYAEKAIPIPLFILLALIFVFIPYLLGSFNTALFVSKKMYHDDVRNHGSGNAGFTNIMRLYGTKAAVITFAGDLLKTILAIMVGWCTLGYFTAYIAGLACFIGHIAPVFYQFKGGKGVVCTATIMFMLDWRIFLIELVLFIGILVSTKYMSLASVISAMAYPIFLNRMNHTGLFLIELIAVIIAIIIVIKHRANLSRIYNGTESKFKFKRTKKVSAEEEAK